MGMRTRLDIECKIEVEYGGKNGFHSSNDGGNHLIIAKELGLEVDDNVGDGTVRTARVWYAGIKRATNMITFGTRLDVARSGNADDIEDVEDGRTIDAGDMLRSATEGMGDDAAST